MTERPRGEPKKFPYGEALNIWRKPIDETALNNYKNHILPSFDLSEEADVLAYLAFVTTDNKIIDIEDIELVRSALRKLVENSDISLSTAFSRLSDISTKYVSSLRLKFFINPRGNNVNHNVTSDSAIKNDNGNNLFEEAQAYENIAEGFYLLALSNQLRGN